MERKEMPVIDRFNVNYIPFKMSANAIVCRNTDGKTVYIHRNAFNALAEAVDFRETEISFPNGKTSTWIEVLTWKRL